MTIQKFQAPTMHEALGEVKRKLGTQAVILHTRSFKAGGVFGIGTRDIIEVTASDDYNVRPRPPKSRPATGAMTAYRRASELGQTLARPAARVPAPLLQEQPAAQKLEPMMSQQSTAPAQMMEGNAALSIKEELVTIRAMVQDVARLAVKDLARSMPDAIGSAFRKLLANDVSEPVAWEIVNSIRASIPASCEMDQHTVDTHLRAKVTSRLKTAGPIKVEKGKTNVAVFVGPTGVGKTTTIAKLATAFILDGDAKVALITNDTYRIAAVDQLRKYADIFSRGLKKVPLTVVHTPADMARALVYHQGCDLVLVDTAGRSQRDSKKLNDLEAFLKATGNSQRYLVVDSTMSRRKALEVAKRFAFTKPTGLILSKIDEAASLGMVLDLAASSKLPFAYCTTGQEVPDDIEIARSNVLAKLVLEREIDDE